MPQEATVFLVAAVAFVVGLIIGILITRYTNQELRAKRRLEVEMNQLQEHNTRYQADVTRHFTKTADLINRMTDSYREVHEHLANGAQTLCDDETFNAMPRLAGESTQKMPSTPEPENAKKEVGPPRDYASGNGSGVLRSGGAEPAAAAKQKPSK